MRGKALILVICTAFTLAGGEADAEAKRCGQPGARACPLQHWMRQELAAPWAKRDFAKLAASFERIEALNPEPEKWRNWQKFARDGAAAARDGKAKSVLAACTHCHRIYRRNYNAVHRGRALD